MREAEGHAPAPAYANPPPPLPEPSDRDREWHARRYDALAGGAGRDPPRDGGARYGDATLRCTRCGATWQSSWWAKYLAALPEEADAHAEAAELPLT